MKLEHMTGPEHPLYAAAWALYEAAFPANERRDAEWQARALAQDAYHMCAAAEDGALCAIAFYWMHAGGRAGLCGVYGECAQRKPDTVQD